MSLVIGLIITAFVLFFFGFGLLGSGAGSGSGLGSSCVTGSSGR